MVAAAIFLIFPLCLSVAALSDLFTMTIPNRISLILVGAFVVLLPFLHLGPTEIGLHFAGAAIMFCACFALFALNVMGGGDAKLLAASALWFGFDQSLLTFVVYVAYLGGLVTILILLMRSNTERIMAMGVRLPTSLTTAKKIPYGVAIGLGGFLAYPSSPLFLAALYPSP
jgi:prepilin peptidase CpaA